jgi:cellulose synthase/poly-beta-1,6-N-acetylglucosamine synthase-like glycosyltransferase
MSTFLLIIPLSIYAIDILLLFLFAMNIIYLMYLSSKHFHKAELTEKRELTEFPKVTVQLPLFNEQYVVERIIKGAIAIDYPKDKLEIQVLDDSTDETLEISRKCVEQYTKESYNIKLLHRTKRAGQKGGALREALDKAEGEFVVIYDSDFIPARNIVKDTLPYFLDDPKTGMVQTRWGHINSTYSILTRAQSVAIDTHFMVDQVARYGEGLFFNFNGTAGVWRKECIYDAGNWQDDTLTEDMDLSYRAKLKGWKFHYVKDIESPAELPVQVNAYKSQQFRWAKGSLQTALKISKTILSSNASLKQKFQAIMHMTYYSVHPLLVLNVLFILPALVIAREIWPNYSFSTNAFLVTMCLMLITPVICAYSQIRLYPDWKRRLKWIPALMLAGTGIAVNNTKAFIEAVIKKPSDFIRTPKLGIERKKQKWSGKKYKIPFSFLMGMEFLLILYLVSTIFYAFHIKIFLIIPFLAFYTVAFGYIFFLGVIQSIQAIRIS